MATRRLQRNVRVKSLPDDGEQDLEEVSVADLWAEIDQEAHRRLNMSGEEFARRYRLGELPDTLAVVELGILLSCVDDARIPT